MTIDHASYWPVHEMVKDHAYQTFESMDGLARYLKGNAHYTNHHVLEQNTESITVILFNYAYAETSVDNFGWRYVIRWLTEEEVDALDGIRHSDPTSQRLTS